MTLRRRFLSSVCLLAVGTTGAFAQDKNPFAEWDRLNRSTQPSTAVAPTEKSASAGGSVRYFSASPQTEASEPAEKATTAAPTRHERLRAASPTSRDAVMTDGVTGFDPDGRFSADPGHAESVRPFAFTSDAKPGVIQAAGAVSENSKSRLQLAGGEAEVAGNIVRVSGAATVEDRPVAEQQTVGQPA
ncbi:MAG: hypothetical protein KDA85_16145, partial [Planctomycetaceae bacterium]|nr:hypothetical protein [Planctomycetaceae bacterium]